MNDNARPGLGTLYGGDRNLWAAGVVVVAGLLLISYAFPPKVRATEPEGAPTVVVGEVLAVRNEAGKVIQVRLRKADGRYLRVELDGYGALLGVKHSGSFAEVRGHVYLKLTGDEQVRWIRINRFRVVPKPANWVEPELICHEPEDEADALEESDAGEADEEDE